MAWLIKRKEVFYIGFREHDRDKYESTGTADPNLAEQARLKKELELQINKGNVRPDTHNINFAALVELYKKESDISVRTQSINKSSWDKWLEFSNNGPVAQSKTSMVIGFKNLLVKQGYAPASISIYLRDLNKLFKFAVSKGLIRSNPCKQDNSEKWAVERPSEEADNFHVLTREEESKLMEFANPILRRVIPFALETGLRLSQIVELDWKQFNPKSSLLKIAPQKRQKARHIPILDKPYIANKGGISAAEAMGPVKLSGSVFGLNDPDQLKKMYARLRIKCGFYDERTEEFLFDFHDLRHTCASRLCQILKPVEVRDFFGWSSVALVDRYTHSRVEDIREKLEKATA